MPRTAGLRPAGRRSTSARTTEVYFADLANPLREERPPSFGLPVEGWSAEREALVVDPIAGRRVPADSLDGFVQLVPTGRLQSVVAAEPGWTVELDTNDEPTTAAVVAWMTDASGAMRPVTEGPDVGRPAD